MPLIDPSLAALLYEQECVVVPGLGAFLVYRESAQIDHVQGLIHPPSKNVRFNAALREDESDLLVLHIARREGMSRESAEELIQRAVEQIHAALSQKQSVPLERVGKLFQDLEGNIRFVSEGNNFDWMAYGLPVLRFYPILRNTRAEQSNAPAADAPAMAPSRPKPSRAALVAASLALLLGLSGLFWQTGGAPSGAQVQEAAVVQPPAVPPTTPTADPASQQAGLITTDEPADAPLDIRLSADGVEENDEDEGGRQQTDKKKKEKSPEPSFSEAENRQMAKRYLDGAETSGAYVIMVGSFSRAENARRLSNKLLKEGYTPFSDTQKGLQRVGVRLNCSESELQRHLAKIRGNVNKGAWVLDR
jgi:hypothetical protein